MANWANQLDQITNNFKSKDIVTSPKAAVHIPWKKSDITKFYIETIQYSPLQCEQYDL